MRCSPSATRRRRFGTSWWPTRRPVAASTGTSTGCCRAPTASPTSRSRGAVGGVGMMYTSGTTGPPKGVVATNYDLAPLVKLLEASGVQAGETMYTGLPLFHGNALLVSAIGSMFLDAKLALAPRFTASGLFDDCRRYDAVEFNGLGGMISILLKQPPRPDDRDHPVRTVLSAGCPPDRWREFEERFGVRGSSSGSAWSTRPASCSTTRAGWARWASPGSRGSSSRWSATTTGRCPQARPARTVFRRTQGPAHALPQAPGGDRDRLPRRLVSLRRSRRGRRGRVLLLQGSQKESMRRLGENISWEIETVLNAHPAVLGGAARGQVEDRRRRGQGLHRRAAGRGPDAAGDPRLLRGQDGSSRHPRPRRGSSRTAEDGDGAQPVRNTEGPWADTADVGPRAGEDQRMTAVEIVGAAMTRFGKFPDSNIRTLAEEAVADALADAALTPGDVDIVFFSNATAGISTGQEMIRGQVALRHSGLLGLPIINVENACASASSAFYLAVNAVASGQAEVAIAVGSRSSRTRTSASRLRRSGPLSTSSSSTT
ncbi:MAG: AMP-binding protein [Solirubrobacteraceae bacterium]